MFNPEGDDYHTEYIELYNLGEAVFLYGWRISDGESFDYLIRAPDSTSITIDSAAYAIIIDSGYWENGETLYDDRILPGTLVLTIEDSQFGDNGLSNSTGETVQLINEDGLVVSERTYHPNDEGGISEERIRADGDESDDNWALSAPGGTPGFRNSVSPQPNDLSVDSLFVEYEQIDDHLELFASCVVENVGAETSSTRQLRLFLGPVEETPDSLIATLAINPMPAETRISVERQATLPLLEGNFITLMTLSPNDDNSANDSTMAEITLTYQPIPEMGWPTITEIMASPPPAPVDCEWLELRNDTDQPLNLSEWSMRDASGTSAEFPQIVPDLDPDSLVVFAETADALNWDGLRAEQLIIADSWFSLNNDGDTIYLVDPNGFIVDSTSYSAPEPGLSLILHELADSVEWFPHIYEPYASPGLGNKAGFPSSELLIDSVSAYVLTGFEGTSDSLIVDFEVRAEGWFIDEEIPWIILIPWEWDFQSVANGALKAPAPSRSVWHSTAIPTSKIRETAGWQWFDLSLGFSNPDHHQPLASFNVFIPASNDDNHLPNLLVTPNPFSPDGDGYEDTVSFIFDLPAQELTVTVRLFDSSGRLLGVIARDVRVPGYGGEWVWDGRSGLSSGNHLPLGLYAYVADIQSVDGESTWRVKGALASAGGR